MAKEVLDPSERQQYIVGKIAFLKHYRDDFIGEIPNEIISAGYLPDGRESDLENPSEVTHKCQRNWLLGVVGFAGLAQRRFPEDQELRDAAKQYEHKICDRTKKDVLEDPHHFIDADGKVHRLTTPEEIQASDDFLTFAIDRLERMLE